MIIQKSYATNYGLILIGYLYKQMASQCPSTISKWLLKFVEQIGLPILNFHGLKHTNATLLITQNIEIPIVSSRLGHTQITAILNLYVHTIIAHNKSTKFALENLLLH